MWKEKKKEKYVLEFCYQNYYISIPFKYSKHLKTNLITYTDLQMIGLSSAKLICNLSGNGEIRLWNVKRTLHDKKEESQLLETRYLQKSNYALYLSSNFLYIVRMNTSTMQESK